MLSPHRLSVLLCGKFCKRYEICTDTFQLRWFSVIMGTGIVSILLHNLPYNGVWLYWISVIIFVLNVCLFCIFLFISILRYTIYPEIWWAMIRHPAQSLFIGTFPMGLATIINMFVFVCVPAWGKWAVYFVGVFERADEDSTLTVLGLGTMVDRRHHCALHMSLSPFRNVSPAAAPVPP